MNKLIGLCIIGLILLAGLAIADLKCRNVSGCLDDLQIEWRESKLIWNEPDKASCYYAKVIRYRHKLLNEAGYYIGSKPVSNGGYYNGMGNAK